MDRLQFEMNGQRIVSGETESKKAITPMRRYLYGTRILWFMFQLYSASKEKILSMVSTGYVNADYARYPKLRRSSTGYMFS